MSITDTWSSIWCNHPVKLTKPGVRTAFGSTGGETFTIDADVTVQARTVLNNRAEEVTIAATVAWPANGPRPELGDRLQLPEEFGYDGPREIVTVTLNTAGNGLTPEHWEVTVK